MRLQLRALYHSLIEGYVVFHVQVLLSHLFRICLLVFLYEEKTRHLFNGASALCVCECMYVSSCVHPGYIEARKHVYTKRAPQSCSIEARKHVYTKRAPQSCSTEARKHVYTKRAPQSCSILFILCACCSYAHGTSADMYMRPCTHGRKQYQGDPGLPVHHGEHVALAHAAITHVKAPPVCYSQRCRVDPVPRIFVCWCVCVCVSICL